MSGKMVLGESRVHAEVLDEGGVEHGVEQPAHLGVDDLQDLQLARLVREVVQPVHVQVVVRALLVEEL
jgi:hypothetical protein